MSKPAWAVGCRRGRSPMTRLDQCWSPSGSLRADRAAAGRRRRVGRRGRNFRLSHRDGAFTALLVGGLRSRDRGRPDRQQGRRCPPRQPVRRSRGDSRRPQGLHPLRGEDPDVLRPRDPRAAAHLAQPTDLGPPASSAAPARPGRRRGHRPGRSPCNGSPATPASSWSSARRSPWAASARAGSSLSTSPVPLQNSAPPSRAPSHR